MIKKLIVATTFAASMLVAVPTANAGSAGACMAKYQSDLEACNLSIPCEMWADVMFAQCMQDLYAGIDPDV